MSDGLRETIEAAMQAESSATPESAPAPAPEVEAAVESAAPAVEPGPSKSVSGRQRDETGKFTPSVPGAKAAAKPEATATATVEAAPPAPQAKAPQSWKPAARELAARLPPEFHPILEEAHRRDRETAVALQRAAEVSRAHQGFQESIRPYEAMIRQSGAAPEQYVGSLLQAAHALSYGQPAQRAEALAGIVAQYASDLLRPDQTGPDGTPSCALDRALVARMAGQRQAAPVAPEYRDPRVDQLYAAIEQARTSRAHAAQAEATALAESFGATHEFLADVKDDVADIVQVWEQRGVKVDDKALERAYNIACQQHPEISKILQGRQAVDASRARAPTVQAAKAAAASIKGSAVAASGPAKEMTLRETIEAAMAQHR